MNVPDSLKNRSLGVVPSPLDARDFRYPSYGQMYAAADLPVEYECPGIDRIDDQGAVSSCVAHALGVIKDWQEAREMLREIRVSRQFIYANRPSKFDHQGPGMSPRMALGNLRNYGVPLEAAWPGMVEYGKEVWPERVGLLVDASAYRIKTYVGIAPQFIAEMKSAIFTTGPLLYCIPVHENFIPDANGRIPMPEGRLIGHHGMAAPGWRDSEWRGINSWGKGWGQNGKCWFPFAYPAIEVWGITDATTEIVYKFHMIEGSTTVWINDQPVVWDRPPILVNDRFMVPARLYAEVLGDKVLNFGRYESGTYAGKMWAVVEKRVPVK